jgi:predicted TIM-barrel fold metal-dependent hydrolase
VSRYSSFQPVVRAPSFKVPANACDTHFHVFGDRATYPVLPGIEHDMPEATIEAAMALHGKLGFSRGVIVATTVNGSDHAVVLDALAKAGPSYRACALNTVLLEQPDSYIQKLHDAGVRGARFNLLKVLNRMPSPQQLRRSIDRARELGWYLKVQPDYHEPMESLELFEKLDSPVIIDHLARAKVNLAGADPTVIKVTELLRRGNFWLLMSNGYKISKQGFPWDDVVPVARAFIEAAPDRMLWALDWPHTFHEELPPDDTDLFDLLPRIADEGERQKILVDNPANIFGFARG